jgi:tetratricopeptide (TPR) repeat protein
MASELQKWDAYYTNKSSSDMDYRQYMEKQAMVKDIGSEIRRGSTEQLIGNTIIASRMTDRIEGSMVRMQTGIQTSIQAQTFAIVASQAALARTFQQGFDQINHTLDMGFAGVSNQLGEMTAAFSLGLSSIGAAIGRMSADICKRLDAIHDIVNNPLLTQSRELYRRALVNFTKGFYEEALEDIKQAIEKSKTDYISWFLMGKIYAFGAGKFSNVISLEESINAFTQAAKYNSVDIAESADAELLAAEIYFFLGTAQYSQSNELSRNKKKPNRRICLQRR